MERVGSTVEKESDDGRGGDHVGAGMTNDENEGR